MGSKLPRDHGVGRNKAVGIFLLGFVSAVFLLPFFGTPTISTNIPANVLQALRENASSKRKFKGSQYWKNGFTKGALTLYESPFARFQLHRVQLEDGKTVVDDWMWYDEADNVNVLVETPKGTFLVFQQTKYALNGQSHAVVGGLIEPGESPLQAGQRELQEELGLQAVEWKELGAYRAAANRGGGTTHAYLARGATALPGMERKSSMAEGEAEHQNLLELTREELLTALIEGKFQEIKWTATVALALITSGKDGEGG